MTTPHEVIQKINQAMCDDDLAAAEKALEEYALDFLGLVQNENLVYRRRKDKWEKWERNGKYTKSLKSYFPNQLYHLFTNQK